MSFTLMDFQKKTVEYGVKNSYSIYALQQGLGKSLCSLATAQETKSKALIICPAYLRLKWKSEIKKFFPECTVDLFENDKQFYRPWDTDFVIISYHYIPKAEMLFDWADMVIYDEAHFLKSMEAKRTEHSHRLIYENSVKRCLLLTGTPIQNRVYEFYSLMAICNYNPQMPDSPFLKKFPTYVDFANHFSHLQEFEILRGKKRVKIQKWEGYKNIDELKQHLKNCYIRFTSDEVLDLPPFTEIEVPVSYEDKPDLLSAFNQFSAQGEYSGISSDVKQKAAVAKVPFTIEYTQNLLDQCEQVVVYSDHVESCELIAKHFGVIGITGLTNMKVRQKLADEFMAGKSQIIVATIGSFSTGIDLYASANMVFNDVCFVPGLLEQAMYRIRRIGQNRRCNFHFILGSIQDVKIWEILKKKIETIKKVV
jgi:SNF2 family DNA or RNA helicase